MEKQYNKEQQEVIRAAEGHHLVLAPPGCGKTEVLAERIRHAHEQLDVDYADMLCLTFTNRASRGMVDRINEMTADSEGIDSLYVGNVHRFCAKFLFDNALVPEETSIIDEDDTISILADIMSEDELKIMGDTRLRHRYSNVMNLQHFMRQYASGHERDIVLHQDAVDATALHTICQRLRLPYTREGITSLYSHIDDHYLKAELQATPEAAAFAAMLYAAREYERYKRRHRLMDFQDMLLDTYDALRSDSSGNYKRYRWIQIDEIQDLNPLQLRLVDLFTDSGNNPTVMYLGDSQQAIFSFMGAQLDTLNRLAERCRGHIHNLYVNYRSPSYLLDVFNAYAQHELGINPALLPTSMRDDTAQKGDLLVCASENSADEYRNMAQVVRRLQEKQPEERTAIIVSYNNEAEEMSEWLNQLKLPHFKVSGRDLFSEPAVKLLLAHLNVVCNEHNFICWTRLLTGLRVITTNAAARDWVHQLSGCALTPTDLLRYEGTSCVQRFIQQYENEEIVIFDTETTGLDVMRDDIVQLAAVKVRRGQVVEGSQLNLFLHTDRPIPLKLGDLDNPLIDEYQRHPHLPPAEALSRFLDYAENCVLLGHNAGFDYHILNQCLRRHGIADRLGKQHPDYMDTLKLARLLMPNARSYKLKALLADFGLEGENSHLADDDIMATKSVADWCYTRSIDVVERQRAFLEKHERLIRRFRTAYRDDYMHACDCLYREQKPGEEPALTAELLRMHQQLVEQRRILPIEKLGHLLRYLREEVIQPNENTLIEQMMKHLQDINTYREADLCGSRSMTERIFVSTVHKAKGLEFDNVIVLGASDNNYPGFLAKDNPERREEEKRRFYVAISRAKRRLIVSYALQRVTTWGRVFPQAITPFIHNILAQFQRHDFF